MSGGVDCNQDSDPLPITSSDLRNDAAEIIDLFRKYFTFLINSASWRF